MNTWNWSGIKIFQIYCWEYGHVSRKHIKVTTAIRIYVRNNIWSVHDMTDYTAYYCSIHAAVGLNGYWQFWFFCQKRAPRNPTKASKPVNKQKITRSNQELRMYNFILVCVHVSQVLNSFMSEAELHSCELFTPLKFAMLKL